MKIVKINLDVTKDTNLPIVSINYDPEHLISEPLVWESITPEIVEVNAKTHEICALQGGKGTICAKDENGFVRVYCVINVKNANENEFTKATATKNKFSSIEPTSRMYSDWYGNDTTDTVTAMGCSGDFYSYSKTGNFVTLGYKAGSVSGIQNSTTSFFRSELINMNNIYLSLTNFQKVVWQAIQFTGILADIYTNGYSDTIGKLIRSILISKGVDIVENLSQSALSLEAWYASEMDAKSYYCDFYRENS